MSEIYGKQHRAKVPLNASNALCRNLLRKL